MREREDQAAQLQHELYLLHAELGSEPQLSPGLQQAYQRARDVRVRLLGRDQARQPSDEELRAALQDLSLIRAASARGQR